MNCCTADNPCRPYTHTGPDLTHDEARQVAARYGGDVFVDGSGDPVASYPPVMKFYPHVATFAGAVRWVWEQHHPYQLIRRGVPGPRLRADPDAWPVDWRSDDVEVRVVTG